MENKSNVKEDKLDWKKISKIFGNCVFYAFVLFLLFFAIANISAKNNQNVPNVFGVGILNVSTDSMEGVEKNKSLYVDDLIFVRIPNEKRIDKLVIGKSIITFYDRTIEGNITHRLVDIIEENGITLYVTQGDKVAKENPSAVYVPGSSNYYLCELLQEEDIIAIYSGSKIGGAGKVLNFLQTTTGFGLCIVLPTTLLLIFQGYILVRNILVLNKHKLTKELELQQAKAKSDFDPEEEKRKIREQLLKEMEEAKNE